MSADKPVPLSAAAIHDRIKQFLLRNSLVAIEGEALTGELNIIESGVVDSILILDLVSYLEEEFGILLSPNDIVAENFRDIDSILSMVRRLRVPP